MKRAIKTHLGDFVAIIVLLVMAVVVAGYILGHERLRFPFVQSAPFKDYAAFQTGQAFTPGQGQSVRVSGVQIGSVGQVTLRNGYAVIEMDIDQKYKNLIHTDATALARPRTGLQDMFIELDPGSKTAPMAPHGYTIPLSNTLPEVNVDEILSSLDSDTRAYLDLLVNGAGQGLKGNGGNELAQVLERFEPTHRDIARLNSAIAVRGRDLQQLINSLARLNTALAGEQVQITQLVDASAIVFRAWASEDQNVSRAIADLPGTLQQATVTLQKVQTFANILGPASANLIPAAQALPAANNALKNLAIPATPIIRNQIRPFVITAQPVVRELRPAAVNLAVATPNIRKVFGVLNHLFNMLGYYPTGQDQHGYLWWLAWLDHNARTVFSVQDANGDFRPLFLQASCATYTQLVNNLGPVAGILLNLTPILSNVGLCPKAAKEIAADYQKHQSSHSANGSAKPGASDQSSTAKNGKSITNATSTLTGSGATNGSGSANGSGSSSLFLPQLTP